MRRRVGQCHNRETAAGNRARDVRAGPHAAFRVGLGREGRRMTAFDMGFEIARLLVTGAAAGGIWFGIFAMVRASKDRGADAKADRHAAADADKRRHTEAMRALEALIERTGAPARSS